MIKMFNGNKFIFKYIFINDDNLIELYEHLIELFHFLIENNVSKTKLDKRIERIKKYYY